MIHSPLIAALQLSFRAALAAGAAVALAESLGLPYPLYALIAAVIVSDLSPAKTRELALHRLAGSVVGAVVGATFSQFLPSEPWAIGIGIFVAMMLSSLLRWSGAAKLAGFTCGIVMIAYSDQAWSFAYHRLVETGLGIGAAVLVSFVPKLISFPEPPRKD